MSRPPLPADAVEMLRRPNPAVMATLRSDGAPVSAPTWYVWDQSEGGAGSVLLSLDEGRVRLRHLGADPRLTLTVLQDGDWYTHVTLLGRVVDLRTDEGLTDIDRISRHYTGQPYPDRVRARVTARMRIDRWHGWGAFKDSDQASV
ncbi:MAG: TIGR03618 family F420-dependent PPOX class oxidoreductase [Nocardioides sp.]|uniref:TIGR03618 family F420-dependent PPOX class oxidoreductase n=1 Tax=Nocardioides sp. TaxID=35761 RepID=UPI0039E30900